MTYHLISTRRAKLIYLISMITLNKIKIIQWLRKELAIINAFVNKILKMIKMKKSMISFALNIIMIQTFILSCQ